MTPRPLETEPVRTATAAGTVGGAGIAASLAQLAGNVDWNSAFDVIRTTGPGAGGILAALTAAVAGRRRASTNATVAKTAVQAHQQGLNGVPLETVLGDDG